MLLEFNLPLEKLCRSFARNNPGEKQQEALDAARDALEDLTIAYAEDEEQDVVGRIERRIDQVIRLGEEVSDSTAAIEANWFSSLYLLQEVAHYKRMAGKKANERLTQDPSFSCGKLGRAVEGNVRRLKVRSFRVWATWVENEVARKRNGSTNKNIYLF